APLDKFLNLKILQNLGKISFSLFITHWAIVGNSNFESWIVGFSTPICPFSPWLVIVFCLFVAWVFWRYVEKPSGKLVNLAGKYSDQLVDKYFRKNSLN
ncbi:MAG: hypothetical protein LBT85_04195, partial [Bifidobacteriaceae bacterium]|nr:hypothetical protein [Bifidobacteriaceae bacterium]